MKATTSFLGTGWGFPPTFIKSTAQVEMLSDEDDIRSSLEILLSTRRGERVMQHRYGCNLDEMLFEPLTTTLKTYIQDMVKTAILYYEPRIDAKKVELDDSRETEGVVLIIVEYVVRSTNSRFNFVYPFYKNEGTQVK
ncbi:GPW/gp25 family protein [Foetidibacter luteolus]|uniref:GPW/gp25 family protein n=1 Tax=Foetidibacter luteolus TaxID=2608880 RepID=UPI00129A59CA|nr:GPW/gp25 family protein [Foetidibacter luteolus]